MPVLRAPTSDVPRLGKPKISHHQRKKTGSSTFVSSIAILKFQSRQALVNVKTVISGRAMNRTRLV